MAGLEGLFDAAEVALVKFSGAEGPEVTQVNGNMSQTVSAAFHAIMEMGQSFAAGVAQEVGNQAVSGAMQFAQNISGPRR